MSHLITTKIGHADAMTDLRAALNVLIAASSLRVRLFQNNFVPDADTVLVDFTEANFAGYAAGVPSNPFNAVTLTGAGYSQIESPDVLTFTASSGATPNTIYGYYVVNIASNRVRWCEKFDAPMAMTTTGNRINITLRYWAKSEY